MPTAILCWARLGLKKTGNQHRQGMCFVALNDFGLAWSCHLIDSKPTKNCPVLKDMLEINQAEPRISFETPVTYGFRKTIWNLFTRLMCYIAFWPVDVVARCPKINNSGTRVSRSLRNGSRLQFCIRVIIWNFRSLKTSKKMPHKSQTQRTGTMDLLWIVENRQRHNPAEWKARHVYDLARLPAFRELHKSSGGIKHFFGELGYLAKKHHHCLFLFDIFCVLNKEIKQTEVLTFKCLNNEFLAESARPFSFFSRKHQRRLARCKHFVVPFLGGDAVLSGNFKIFCVWLYILGSKLVNIFVFLAR